MITTRWEALKAKPWPEFFAGLSQYLADKKAVRRQRVGPWWLCSLYLSPDEWSIWLEVA